MRIKDAQRVLRACIYADVPLELTGDRGIGKTELVRDTAKDWRDPFMAEGEKGIPMFALYCATQEVTDLIGFPVEVWESDGTPVVKGIESKVDNDRIVTDWAPPKWANMIRQHCDQFEESDKKTLEKMKKEGSSPEELWAFWNRPKFLVFLDELKRAQREVINVMYPFLLDKTLHMEQLPRGTRVVTADNFAGAYDVKEPDEAFMSRLCHITVENHINDWMEWAVEHNIYPKIRSFLATNPTMLLHVPQDQKDAAIRYEAIPDPRRYGGALNRLEKYGRYGLIKYSGDLVENAIKLAIQGVVGVAVAAAYWKHSDKTISMEDILVGKGTLKASLAKITKDVEKNKLLEKLQIECPPILKDRKFDKKEAGRLREFVTEITAERATGILQAIFVMKNSNELDNKWVDELMKGKEVLDIIKHLINKKNI